MKPSVKSSFARSDEFLLSEMLILPDGRVLVQNLTQPMAEILRELNPHDPAIAPRAKRISEKPL